MFGLCVRPCAQLFPREVFTLESYKWAVQTVRSRGLWWDDEPHIAPLLDIGLFSWNVAPIGAQLSPNSAAAVTSTANVGMKHFVVHMLHDQCLSCTVLQGSWIALKSPRKSTFAIGRGELVVFPLLDNRHMLYGQHGFADVPIALPTHHKSQPGNLSGAFFP